jgi:hypothetical protein
VGVIPAVLVKLLALLAAWGAVLAFRKSSRVGSGLLPKVRQYRQVAIDSLYYPAAFGAVFATLALLATSGGWRSVKLAAILGGGFFAVCWPFYFLSRVVFAKIAFNAIDSHRSFAEERSLGFQAVGPEYRDGPESRLQPSVAAVCFAEGHWLALVSVASGSVGQKGYSQRTRLERPVGVDVGEPEVWNLKPIGGLLGQALAKHSGALAALGSSLSLIRLEPRRLVFMGAPNRRREKLAALVDFADALAVSVEELAATAHATSRNFAEFAEKEGP